MADDVAITAGAGTAIATQDISSRHFQQIIAGDVVRVSDGFTRVADTNAYAVGDHVASTVTAGSVTAANSAFILAAATRDAALGGFLTQIVLHTTGDITTDADFRVHLFDIDPYTVAPTSGDNAAISLDTTISDNYLGYIDVSLNLTLFEAETVGVGVPLLPIPIKANSGTTIWGVLEARAAYVPASSEVFTLYAQIAQG